MPKISNLPEVESNQEADLVAVVQIGVTKKTTLAKIKTLFGIGSPPPTPTAANDFQVAVSTGSPAVVSWAKKTLAEVLVILGIKPPEVLIMLLDKDVAIATGDNVGNIQCPVPSAMWGKNLSDKSRIYIPPLGTASTSGVVSFNVVRHRPTASPVAVDMTLSSPAFSIAQDAFTSDSPSIDTSNDDLAEGDFFSFSCEAAGTGAKGPLWAKVVAEKGGILCQ